MFKTILGFIFFNVILIKHLVGSSWTPHSAAEKDESAASTHLISVDSTVEGLLGRGHSDLLL